MTERSLIWRLQDEDLQSVFLYHIKSHLSLASTCIQVKSMNPFYRMGHSFPSRVTRRDNGAMPTIVLALHCIKKVANYSLFNFALMPPKPSICKTAGSTFTGKDVLFVGWR